MCPIFPQKQLIGAGSLPHGFWNPECERKATMMVRNRRERSRSGIGGLRSFLKGWPGEEEKREKAEVDAENGYLELLKTDTKAVGEKETERLGRMVERKGNKGKKLCLSL